MGSLQMVGGEGFDQVALKKPRLEAGGAEQTTREGTQDQPQLEVEIVGTAQMKEQEILKRREALLEGTIRCLAHSGKELKSGHRLNDEAAKDLRGLHGSDHRDGRPAFG